jgi:hypothetical protein
MSVFGEVFLIPIVKEQRSTIDRQLFHVVTKRQRSLMRLGARLLPIDRSAIEQPWYLARYIIIESGVFLIESAFS